MEFSFLIARKIFSKMLSLLQSLMQCFQANFSAQLPLHPPHYQFAILSTCNSSKPPNHCPRKTERYCCSSSKRNIHWILSISSQTPENNKESKYGSIGMITTFARKVLKSITFLVNSLATFQIWFIDHCNRDNFLSLGNRLRWLGLFWWERCHRWN